MPLDPSISAIETVLKWMKQKTEERAQDVTVLGMKLNYKLQNKLVEKLELGLNEEGDARNGEPEDKWEDLHSKERRTPIKRSEEEKLVCFLGDFFAGCSGSDHIGQFVTAKEYRMDFQTAEQSIQEHNSYFSKYHVLKI